MIIYMIDGLFGILIGIGIGIVASNLIGYEGQISLSTCLIAVCFSLAVGVFFGYYTANKAVKMNHIDA